MGSMAEGHVGIGMGEHGDFAGRNGYGRGGFGQYEGGKGDAHLQGQIGRW